MATQRTQDQSAPTLSLTQEQLNDMIAGAVAQGVQAARPVRKQSGPSKVAAHPDADLSPVTIDTDAKGANGERISFDVSPGFTKDGQAPTLYVGGARVVAKLGSRIQRTWPVEVFDAALALAKQIHDAAGEINERVGLAEHSVDA